MTVRALRSTALRIQVLTAQASHLEGEIGRLVGAVAPWLLELPRMGPLSAAQVLVSWSHAGRIRSEAAFAALAGVAPVPASSGQVTRYRLNRSGDRQLNRALHTLALVRLRDDPTTRAYAARRRVEGKSPREIRRCVKRAIASHLFKLLQRCHRPDGVVFDSGDVLMRPTSPNDAAATEAWRRWFGGPRFVDPPPALLQELVEGEDDEIAMEPVPEVVLQRLRDRGLRLGVLTENWPSVETAYQRLGLRPLFHAFVISSQEARRKDDPELFAIAAGRMELPAEAKLFVDDWPPHVQTALAVGFQGAVLDRHADAPAIAGLTYLTDLHDVERLVTAATPPPSPT